MSDAVTVRLPHEMRDVCRKACRLLGISMSQFIRAGIESKLAQMIPPCVEIAKDQSAPPTRRMRIMEFLHDAARASMCLSAPMEIVNSVRANHSDLPIIHKLRIRRSDPALRSRLKEA